MEFRVLWSFFLNVIWTNFRVLDGLVSFWNWTASWITVFNHAIGNWRRIIMYHKFLRWSLRHKCTNRMRTIKEDIAVCYTRDSCLWHCITWFLSPVTFTCWRATWRAIDNDFFCVFFSSDHGWQFVFCVKLLQLVSSCFSSACFTCVHITWSRQYSHHMWCLSGVRNVPRIGPTCYMSFILPLTRLP